MPSRQPHLAFVFMALALALLGVGLGATSTLAAATVIVDAASVYQTMEGWEFTPRMGQIDKAADAYDPRWLTAKDEVIRRMVEDVGINRIRLEVKSGMENPVDYHSQFVAGRIGYLEVKSHWYEKINDDGSPTTHNLAGFQFAELDDTVENILLPMQARMAARGEKLYVNLNYIDFSWSTQGTLSHGKNPAEYAELIHLVFDHLKTKYGLVPDAFELVLEPDNTVDWSGTRLGNGLIAVADELAAAGYHPEFIAPSCASTLGSVTRFDQLAAVPGALARLDTIAYHRYSGATTANLQAIADRGTTYGLKTGMLEWTNATIATLHQDLTLVGNSAWQQWGAADIGISRSAPSYLYAIDVTDPVKPVVTLTDRANLFQQYFKYVRVGARRIAAVSDSTNHLTVGFVNPDGSHVVVVQNTSTAPIDISGLPAGTYGITRSSNGGARVSCEALPDVTIGAGGIIPVSGPIGAITVFSKSPGINPAPMVDAGPDRSLSLPTIQASLDATVNDPGDSPTATWSVVSKPVGSTVAFANAVAVDTLVTIDLAGTYVLRLTADDGVNPAVSDTMTLSVAAAPPTGGGPVGHWRLDETGGLTATDSSPSGNHGTIVGTASAAWGSGKVAGGLVLDGLDDGIQVTDAAALNVGATFTLAAWIKPTTFGEAGYGRILRKSSGSNSGYDLMVKSGSGGVLEFKCLSGAIDSTAGSVRVGVWQHVALTYDGTLAIFYVDGVERGRHTRTLAVTAVTAPLFLGRDQAGVRAFAGSLDEVRIYDRGLTASEIVGLATVIVPPVTLPTVKINFQPATAPTVSGYLVDSGLVYADRGNGFTYGWNVANNNTRDRNSARATSQLDDTLIFMDKGSVKTWSLALPDGTYEVRLHCGDPSYTDQIHTLRIDDVLVSDPDGQDHYDDYLVTVIVTGGQLTLASAAGALDPKLDFIEIIGIPAGSG